MLASPRAKNLLKYAKILEPEEIREGRMARTQVVVVGGGPSGLLLSQLLHKHGIESVVLERHSREYVEARIRAGLLEWSTVALLEEAGVGTRLLHEGLVHDGFELAFDGRTHRIDLKGLAGHSMLVYGQTEIQRDLADARIAAGADIVWEAKEVSLHGFLDGQPPRGIAAPWPRTPSSPTAAPDARRTSAGASD